MVQHSKATFSKWEKIINEFNRSGLTPSRFCRKKKINDKTFYTWRKKINEGVKSYTEDSFSELNLKESSEKQPISPTRGEKIRIILNDRHSIAVEDDFNESVLLKVIKVLGKSIC